MDIDELFDTYIYNWLCRDIERELEWARSDQGAGNVLCALGLFCYTEYLGSLVPHARKLKSRRRFETFFRRLGPQYSDLIDHDHIKVYDVFRSGTAHEYFVKGTCTVAMLNTVGTLDILGPPIPGSLEARGPSFRLVKPVSCGIGRAPNGSYWIVIEKYYQDFRAACETLHEELSAASPPPSPPITHHQLSDSNASW
jgi:hypothetical protein